MTELTEKRRRWVEINRENGFEDGIKRLLGDLYPNNAHFIYELLQNAEDAQAHVVTFILSNDEIEVEHDGCRLFSFDDVESITSIGESTKRDENTAIGKFGVGFKAVFAYTNTPEIHSGQFHFKITDLVVPDPVEELPCDSKTRFIFPFNNPSKNPMKAVYEIEKELRNLDDSALLFLSNIKKIEYLLCNGQTLGSIERKNLDDNIIEIDAIEPDGNIRISYWLRYIDKAVIVDEDGKSSEHAVSISYQLKKITEDDKQKKQGIWEIVQTEPGRVCIYFPAEKETSKLKFHMHAPFASTVARDSVRDCESNYQLLNAIAELVVKSLPDIRQRNLLKTSFLAVLPNPADGLSEFYEPIRKAIVSAFKEQELTPTRTRQYACADSLYQGLADICEVITDSDLSYLLDDKPPLWAVNAPQVNQREDRFLTSLEMEEWGWKDLNNKFNPSDEENLNKLEEWIEKKDDAWLMQLYALLDALTNQSQSYTFNRYPYYPYSVNRELKIIKCTSDDSDVFAKPVEAFFKPEGIDDIKNLPASVNFVKPDVYCTGRAEKRKEAAEAFLKNIGVRQYDKMAIIEMKIKRYDECEIDISEEENISDIQDFLECWRSNPVNISMFENHPFIGSSLFCVGKQMFPKLMAS